MSDEKIQLKTKIVALKVLKWDKLNLKKQKMNKTIK